MAFSRVRASAKAHQVGLNDMDKISYLDIHARYLDIDMIQYDYGFGENQAFFRKIKRLF